MPELVMRPFSAGNEDEARLFQISDQLTNLARHTSEAATCPITLPVSIPAPRWRHDFVAHGLGAELWNFHRAKTG
jgi:hypothetical protein